MNEHKPMTMAELYRAVRETLGGGISFCVEVTVWDHVHSGLNTTWSVYAVSSPKHAHAGESNDSMRGEGPTPEAALDAFCALFATVPDIEPRSIEATSSAAMELP